MRKRGNLAVAAMLGVVIAVIFMVPAQASSVSSLPTASNHGIDFPPTTAERAMGAPGPMHGPSVAVHPSNLADAVFPPTVSPPHAGAQSFVPGCSKTACPMGVTDYGITPTGTSYGYTAATMSAYADVSVLKIGAATGGGCLDPDATGCLTIQENSIANGVADQNNKGQYWTQNVPEVALDGSCSSPCVTGDYSVTWLDNIWNFSSTASYLNPATTIGNGQSACSSWGVGTAGTLNYYACVGPTDYGLTLPFTIWAMTSVGPNTNAYYGPCVGASHSCVAFWGAIFEGATESYYGWYDSIAFTAGSHGAGSPTFRIGNATTPFGLPYDAEWVMGGPGGGSSVKVTNSNVMLQSEFNTGVGSSGTATGTWMNVKHAWSSGEDTAESVTNVDMQSYFGSRYLATATKGTNNPHTSLW
ncbi:MAG: thermopsin [Thermoplasmata archaeon]|nr:thermopsin [Thermoplasmata archaeon]